MTRGEEGGLDGGDWKPSEVKGWEGMVCGSWSGAWDDPAIPSSACYLPLTFWFPRGCPKPVVPDVLKPSVNRVVKPYLNFIT